MILKYQKITDEYTTITLVEPDYADEDPMVTELCTIGKDTYVHIPDDIVLPEQPSSIEAGMETISITYELKTEIKAMSPHVRLINARVVEKIREKYTANDEFKMYREFVKNGSNPATSAYIEYVEECREWGNAQKELIGL